MRLPERLSVAGIEERSNTPGTLIDTEGMSKAEVGALGPLGTSGTKGFALRGWGLLISSSRESGVGEDILERRKAAYR